MNRRLRSIKVRSSKAKLEEMPKSISEPHCPAIDAGDGTTGLVFQGCYLPEEILRILFSFVDYKSLLQCRAVCKYWRYEIDNEVWKYVARRDQCLSINAINSIINAIPNSWLEFYLIATNEPFGKNLLRNNSGQDKLTHWEVLSNGGNKWSFENPPIGSEHMPDDVIPTESSNFCFVTSFHSCSKCQTIELERVGLTPRFMDSIQPNIHISEWYARRFDCGAVYEMKVHLLDVNRQVLKEFEHRVTMDEGFGNHWHKICHEFKNYGPGVRFVMFYHGGMDTQYWAGHYGSKMARASVTVSLSNYDLVDSTNTSASEAEPLSDV